MEESSQSLVARIRQERAKERQWQKETAQRKKKYQAMERGSSLAQQEGQLTTAALSSHNEEKVRNARRESLAKRGLPRRGGATPSSQKGQVQHQSGGGGDHPHLRSEVTSSYTDTLSRIETCSTACSAVPLSLLGAIPPSTAAGKITLNCALLTGRLSARKKRLSDAESEVQEAEQNLVREEDTTKSKEPRVIEDASETRKRYPTPPRPEKPWEQKNSEEACVVSVQPPMTKSVTEFLVLEKKAQNFPCESKKNEVQSEGQQCTTLPPIRGSIVGEQPIRMILPPPRPMVMAVPQGAVSQPHKNHPPRTDQVPVVADNSGGSGGRRRGEVQKKPSIPRGTTAPQSTTRSDLRKRRVSTSDVVLPSSGLPSAPKSIIQPFLKAVTVLPKPRTAEGEKLHSDVQVFRPGAFGLEQDRQRGVRFDMNANAGGDVFTANDGVQFNVLRSMDARSSMSSSVNGSGQGLGFAAALRMAQLLPGSMSTAAARQSPLAQVSDMEVSSRAGATSSTTPMSHGILFGAPRPDLFQEDDDGEVSNDDDETLHNQERKNEDLVDEGDDFPLDYPPSTPEVSALCASKVEDEMTQEEALSSSPMLIRSAPTRPDDVVPTGFSMEEKALLAALSNIKQKEKQIRQHKSKAGAGPITATATKHGASHQTKGGALAPAAVAALPVSMHQPTPMKRRQAGGRRYIGIQPQ